MRTLPVLLLAAGASLFSGYAYADCNSAISSYNMAISDISDYLKRYTDCLSSSSGLDDCSPEFRRLSSAQSDLEFAISQYRAYCRR